MNRLFLVPVLLLAVVLAGCGDDDSPAGPSGGRTIRVPSEEPTIQAGIDAASAGDTVLVASGTYYEHDIIMKSGVYLSSETGQSDCVTVDAQQEGRVFYCYGVDSLASIVGFMITGAPPLYGEPGGGMRCIESCPAVTNCKFFESRAYYGGGMSCEYDSNATLTNCVFLSNEADSGGGGMFCFYSSPTLINCTLSGNQAGDVGGGMFCMFSSPALANCIIAFSSVGEAIHCNSTPLLECCDIYGNAGGDWESCIADQYGVAGNFSADPLFCDFPNGDITLASNSPCLPDGNDCGELIGAYGQGCEESPVYASSWGSIKALCW